MIPDLIQSGPPGVAETYHLVSHKQTIRDMLDKYHSLKSKKVLCSREYMKRGAYNYNWWVPPS